MKIHHIAFLALSAFLASTASTFAGLTNCQKLFKKYEMAGGHKAYATTMGNDPGFHPSSCHFAANFTFKKKAEQKAVELCNRVRRKMDGGRCKVIHSK